MIEFEDIPPEYLPGDIIQCPFCPAALAHTGVVKSYHSSSRYLVVRYVGREFDELLNLTMAKRA